MTRRILLVLTVLLLLVSGYAWYSTRTDSEQAGPQTPTKKPPTQEPEPEPWDGTASRSYGITFIRAGEPLTLSEIQFKRLDHATAPLAFVFTVLKGNGKPPSWLSRDSLMLVSVSGETFEVDTFRVEDAGPLLRVRVAFRSLPVESLANGELSLFLRSPSGSFRIGFVPPSPPAGHGFAERALELSLSRGADRDGRETEKQKDDREKKKGKKGKKGKKSDKKKSSSKSGR